MYSISTLKLADHVPTKWVTYAEYVLNLIIKGNQRNRNTVEFIPIHTKRFREAIPNRVVVPLKAELLNAAIIEMSPNYIPGEKSYGYRLGAQYRDQPISIERRAPAMTARLRDPVHRWLEGNFARLDCDIAAAHIVAADHDYPHTIILPALEIAAKAIHFTNDKYGRVHSPLTQLYKPLRQTLNIGGEPLYSVDVASCQPLVIGYILNNPSAFKAIKFAKSFPYKSLNQSITPIQSNQSITLMKCIASPGESLSRDFIDYFCGLLACKTISEVDAFVWLCERGLWYSFLDYFVPTPYVKAASLKVFYSSNNMKVGMPNPTAKDIAIYRAAVSIKQIIHTHFPVLSWTIREFKMTDRAYLARLAQLFESTIMIDRVCRRLMADNIPVFTLHDSILTTRHYVDTVETTIRDEFGKLGLSPTLHQECWSKPLSLAA